MTTARHPDPARRSTRSHAAVLAAAADLLVSVGYDSMTIEGIASLAGVGKQTIYRWWPAKSAIVLDLLAGPVEQRAGFPDSGDLTADLSSQIRAIIALIHEPVLGTAFRALVAESQHDPALATSMRERIFGPRIADCKQRLRAAQDAGQIAADVDLDIAVDLLYGGFYHRLLLGVAPLTLDHADHVVRAALAGIAPKPQPRGRPRRDGGVSRGGRRPGGSASGRSTPR